MIVLLRLLSILKSRYEMILNCHDLISRSGLSILAAVFFVFDFVLSIVAIGVYTGFYVGSCCPGSCSADGGYARSYLSVVLM